VSRLLLHGAISSIQCSWVKLGDDLCREVLNGGVNDLGGTLMDENISRAAGASHGQMMDAERFEAIVTPLGRTLAQRTTLYGRVPGHGGRPGVLAAAT
jgi:FO synthase